MVLEPTNWTYSWICDFSIFLCLYRGLEVGGWILILGLSGFLFGFSCLGLWVDQGRQLRWLSEACLVVISLGTLGRPFYGVHLCCSSSVQWWWCLIEMCCFDFVFTDGSFDGSRPMSRNHHLRLWIFEGYWAFFCLVIISVVGPLYLLGPYFTFGYFLVELVGC